MNRQVVVFQALLILNVNGKVKVCVLQKVWGYRMGEGKFDFFSEI